MASWGHERQHQRELLIFFFFYNHFSSGTFCLPILIWTGKILTPVSEDSRHYFNRNKTGFLTNTLCNQLHLVAVFYVNSKGGFLAVLPSSRQSKWRHCRYSLSLMKPFRGVAQPSASTCTHCMSSWGPNGHIRQVRGQRLHAEIDWTWPETSSPFRSELQEESLRPPWPGPACSPEHKAPSLHRRRRRERCPEQSGIYFRAR